MIQDLIAVGMQVMARSGREVNDVRRRADLELVSRLEEAVRQLRRVVFELRTTTHRSLDASIHDLAREAGRVLGHEPAVTLLGPVDSLPGDLGDDLLAVLREALSNVARHAGATYTSVALDAGPATVTLTVQDDGAGLPTARRAGQGLANIEDRAVARRGRARVGNSPLGGARLTWSCPWPGDTGTDVTGAADGSGGGW